MIIDCFTFFNELDLLELRLRMLSPHVDYFVLVESNKTQSLQNKPLIFDENKDRFKEFEDKILHAAYWNPTTRPFKNYNDSWEQEKAQRATINNVLSSMRLTESDIVMVSDLDEIPNVNREILSDIRPFENGIYTIPNKFFAYYMNLQGFHPDGSPKYSDGTIVATYKQFQKYGVANLWAEKARWPKLYSLSGWHLSWLGGPQKVREKSLSCIEPFDKSCVPSEEEMDDIFEERVIRQGYFNINDPSDNSVKMKVVDPKLPIQIEGTEYEKYLYK